MNAATPTVRPPDPANIFDHLLGYQRSAALKAGIELELFTAIARGNRTADAIAKALNASPRGVRILCDYLAISKLLVKRGDEYSLSSDAAMFLDQNSPAYLGSIAHFLLDPRIIGPYLHLPEVVRNGRTTLPGEGTVSPDNPVWVEFARQMGPMMHGAATEIAELVASDREMRVLDIAAGHGLFGIMVARSSPKARITAVDWPNVLAVAAANAEKFGVADRHTGVPGDAFKAEFGGPYDVVLVTNFLHHFDPATCEQLMRKIFAALAPGGRCVTLDFIPNEDRVSPPIPASFALTMLGTTASGDVYTFAEYESMFRNAGFAGSTFHPLQRSAESVIVSTKP